jgi:hypothetical protein
MITTLYVAIAAVLLAGPALAGGAGYTVNISTTTQELYSDRITEVEIDPEGTYTFPDPLTAPELSQQSAALSTARTELGIPMGTTVTVEGTTPIGSDEQEVEIVESNYNPVDNPDYVIGDPEDYFTWIAVGNSNVDVFVDITTTHYTFHRLSADVAASCSPGYYSANGQEPCDPCPAGSAQSASGATSCTPCTAGTFASAMGQAFCSACGPGTYELDIGSSACDPCPGGQATPCNNNGVCSDGPSGNGTCICNAGYSGFACENGPPTTTLSTTTTTMSTTTTSTTSTTLPGGPCAETPQTGCVAASVAGLQIQVGATPAKNKLKWKLSGGSLAVDQAALGDPEAATSWTLCIYDSTFDVPFLAGSVTVGPSASLWASSDPKGWKYKDKAGSQNGVTGVSLKTGVAGKPKAQVKAAGASLPLPVPVDTMRYFDQSSTVTVQLVKEGGAGGDLCWTSEFDAAATKLNTPAKFKATAK